MPNPNSQLPIVPGCLCILLTSSQRPDLTGTQCIAIKRLHEGTRIEVEGLLCQIDRPDVWAVDIPDQPNRFLALTSQLRRIDGHRPDGADLAITVVFSQSTRGHSPHTTSGVHPNA